MQRKSIRWAIPLALTAIAALTACQSPIVTGIKVHMQNNEYQAAVHLADSLIATGDSLDAELWYWKGRAEASLSDWVESARSLQTAHELAPGEHDMSDYWFTFFNAAGTLLGDGEVTEAVDLLETGNAIIPGRPNFDLMLGDVELNMNSDLDAALERFLSAADKGAELMTELEAQLEDADDPMTYEYYAQDLDMVTLTTLQAHYNAGSVLSMMAQQSPDQPAELLQQARDQYMAALDIDPTNVDALEAVAESYMLEGEYDAAIETFDEALTQIEVGVSEGWLDQAEADELRANMLVSKGYALMEMEEMQEAIAELQAAREIIGDDYLILATMANVRFAMEEYEQALERLGETLGIEGLSPDELASVYYTQFACYNRLEQDEEAAEALETALQFAPENARYWELLASTYSRLGMRNEAIEAMEKAEQYGSGQE